jgi:hypothetical protein
MMSGTWRDLTNQPAFGAGTMLLLTDGSVLCHDESNNGTNHWWKLVPDSGGGYLNGTWQQLADGPNAPLYFACAVLRDGRVFIAGGEYNNGADVELLAAEIYDPVADHWTVIGTPTGWNNIGDAPSVTLPDGRILLGDIYGNRTAIYDPVANTWTAGPTKDDTRGTEETWVLMADQSVLAIECDRRPRTEKYVIAANQWVSSGSTPVTLVDAGSDEVGAALALPDGRVFCIGATNNTALYTMPPIASQPGTWAAGPSFPAVVAGRITGAKDAPACLLPNGRVLCIVAPYDPGNGNDWGSPLYLYEYDPVVNTLTQVASPSNGGGSPFTSRLILLPTGEVLHTNGSSTVAIYTPDGAPDPVWKPTITSVPAALHPGQSHVLHGRQINGLSQAVIYGDEGAMATNYPIVRLVSTSNGDVFYCRTHDHSTMAIQTGTVIHSTQFTVPATVPLGTYRLCVIANGISSDCVAVAVTHKRWKELKGEIKEIKDFKEGKEFKEVKEIKEGKEFKEHIKVETDGQKLIFEDLTKISESDWRERFGDQGWGEVIRQLVNRSDIIEGELRAFIKKGERPETGIIPQPAPATKPASRPAKTKKKTAAKPAASKAGGKK